MHHLYFTIFNISLQLDCCIRENAQVAIVILIDPRSLKTWQCIWICGQYNCGKYRSDPYEDINSYLQVDEIVYYLQGMQSDVYKTAATMLNNHTKFIIIPEVSQPYLLYTVKLCISPPYRC